MSARGYAVPPRLASWFVSLFACGEREAILGDLREEFSGVASTFGPGVARRWYWRQAGTTIVHLFFSAFRVAPLSTGGAVIAGLILGRFIFPLQERAIFAVLHRSQLFDHHFKVYLFLVSDGLAAAHVIASLLVGCAVGLAAKGRELVAATTLVFILCAMTATSFAWLAARNVPILWGMLPWYFADWLAILIGGAIVRTHRSSSATLPSAR
jgi:hypothetical protein